jgi:hypothetical protein
MSPIVISAVCQVPADPEVFRVGISAPRLASGIWSRY